MPQLLTSGLPRPRKLSPDSATMTCWNSDRKRGSAMGAVAGLGMTVRSAHVDTLGPQAVDVFYLCEWGAGPLGERRSAEAAHAVRRALTPAAAAARPVVAG